ncbi:MAG TPA: NUDIX domain-containing protein [Candidatus Thermoplasmatota archaeon]|nr:NUDIX domain-containing protein [Candidatus Thermoplasmatota archaeon]
MPEVTARFVDCHVFRRVGVEGGGTRDEWLLMKRAPHILLGGTWQMVSGHIESGETAYQAAARELREETGLAPLHFYQASYVNRFYLAASDQVILSPVFCAEAAPDAKVRLSEEHTEFAWLTPDEAERRLPWPGQRRSLAVIRDQFILREPFPQSCLDSLLKAPKLDKRAARGL